MTPAPHLGPVAVNARPRTRRLFYRRFVPILIAHLGALSAPFLFSPSALLVMLLAFVLTGLGVTVGLHRLLTHRSFRTYRLVRRAIATLGALAFQGGVITWVATHRMHHAFSDTHEDPHSPTRGFWWGHMLWEASYDERVANPELMMRWVKDLRKDRYLRFLERCEIPLQIAFFGLLYAAGEWFAPGLGLSWAVYGVFLRVALVQQVTWMVNSFSHKWGYRNDSTDDTSTNNWFVAILTFGEGWHNNHHAMPSSATFQRRWFEIDLGYMAIRALSAFGLAWALVTPRGSAVIATKESQ